MSGQNTAESVLPSSSSVASTPTSGTSGSSGAAAGALKSGLRGQDFAAGEGALSPVQRKAPEGGGKTPPKTPATKGGATKPGAQNTAGAPANNIPKPEVATLDKKKALKLAQDLGKATSIVQANAMVGSFLGALAPTPGTTVDASLKVAVMVKGIYLSIGYNVALEHTDHGMEMKGKMAVGIGIGIGGGAGLMGGSAFATIQGAMGFTAKGDSTGECLDLVMLGLDQWLRVQEPSWAEMALSPAMAILRTTGGGAWVADALFGAGFDDKVLAAMDPKSKGEEADTLTFTESLGIDAGASGKMGLGGDMDLEAGVNANVRHEQQSTIAKNDKGKLDPAVEKSGLAGEMGMKVGVGGFSGKGSSSFFMPYKDVKSSKLDLSLEVGFPGAGAVGDYAKQLWSVYQSAIMQAAGKLTNGTFQAEFKNAAINGVRGAALSALEAAGFVTSALKFTFAMEGKERKFSIEVTRSAEFGVKAGAGIAGATVDLEATTGTKILEFTWAAGK